MSDNCWFSRDKDFNIKIHNPPGLHREMLISLQLLGNMSSNTAGHDGFASVNKEGQLVLHMLTENNQWHDFVFEAKRFHPFFPGGTPNSLVLERIL